MSSLKPPEKGWIEISVSVDPVAHEAVGHFLFELGCSGFVEESGPEPVLKGYIPFRDSPEALRERTVAFLHDLTRIFPEIREPVVRIGSIAHEDWGLTWRRFFHPDLITPNLMVVPAWEKTPDSHPAHVITVDPGPAFGTGGHSTTRMCLQAMETIPATGSPPMLDVGTGSGILAMYGAKLGFGTIVAVDTDPEALRWAERNIELNGLTGSIRLSTVRVEDMTSRFSLVVANLILGEILRLFEPLAARVAPEGRLVLSGILTEQLPQMAHLLEQDRWTGVQTLAHEEWSCLILEKTRLRPSGGA